MIEFKGNLIGFYNSPDMFQREFIGVIFWQNYTQTKIKQDNWKTTTFYQDSDLESYPYPKLISAITYN